MNILIRRATNDDMPALEHLISDSVRRLSKGYYSEQQIESALVNIFGVDSQLIVDGTYFVAEAAGQIVGCGGWSMRKTLFGGDQTKSGEDALLDPDIEPARIRAFFVHPGWARKGIGSRILDACEDAALKAGYVTLELVATLPGEPFYKALGFAVAERFEITMPGDMALPAVRMNKHMEGAYVTRRIE